jgi:Uma2 family endonuclease
MSTSTLLTIEDVDRMIARGKFDGPNAKRVELIRGELREMSPTGTDHINMVNWLNDWTSDVLDRGRFQASIQNAVEIPELATMPHPDVVWLRRKRAMTRRPRVPDVMLLIEVADSSLTYDTTVKAQIYSEAGVRDYWVVDLPNRKLHVFRDPSESGFQSREAHSGDELVVPLLVPGVSVVVNELFEVLDPDDSEA